VIGIDVDTNTNDVAEALMQADGVYGEGAPRPAERADIVMEDTLVTKRDGGLNLPPQLRQFAAAADLFTQAADSKTAKSTQVRLLEAKRIPPVCAEQT